MLRANNNTSVTIREIEFSIRIKDKDSSFAEILDLLKDELTVFRNNARPGRRGTENPVRDFIQTNIERSIIVRENTRVYFLNYKEKEGSLRITFTLLVVTGFINYASLRQSLDSLIKDTIADYFEELLERHIPVSVTVQSNDNEVVTLSDSVNSISKAKRPKSDKLTRFTALAALFISLAISGFYLYNSLRPEPKAEKLSIENNYIDSLLEARINEAVKDQKFTINLYKIADTLNAEKSTVQIPAGK